ncbi:hypothetical protein N8T08_003442 [Aspergillus melleus]|uniref:Uncharacterized protein n=1 Tax=Aspergillus melleus TaxID=138277 RepID=A0ACC3BG71_9EURO|nr:hypothetical protein N8T08_003442 [Aspergillus melleus]
MKQHEQAQFATRAGMTRRTVSRPYGAATDRFRQATLQSTRGDAPSQATGRARLSTPAYLDYEYPDGAFQGGSLQGDELQPYAPTLRDHQRQQVQPSFTGYESEMVYNLNQQGPTQSPYEVVPPYATRQSAAMDALSSQFAVPPYYNEPTGPGVPSPYLASQLPLAAYNQPGPIGRSGTTQPFPATMPDMTPVGTTGRLEPSPPSQLQPSQSQPQPQQPVAGESFGHPNESYGQFHQALRETFADTRAGRLVEASRSLLEISEWLVTNARELVLYADRLQLWNDFNICWLAVCQKQKDLTQELLQTGRQPPRTSLLAGEVMENLGKELISLCDRMEQHGLVDYQMGIWEEEILCVLSQCLDLMDSRPEALGPQAISVPATATSRS